MNKSEHLGQTHSNSTIKIKSISLDSETVHRLAELGIYVESEVRVVKNDYASPIILDVKGSRVAIGPKEAKNIAVIKL